MSPPTTSETAERYIPLARKLAWQATRRWRQDFDEAYSDALLGLAKAARRSRPPEKYIRGEILHGIRDRSGLRSLRERGNARPEMVSLEAPVGFDGTLADLIATGEPGPHAEAERSELWRTVDRLPPRERLAIRLYYQWEMSQDEIAGVFGCSQMQVSRYLAQARLRLAA